MLPSSEGWSGRISYGRAFFGAGDSAAVIGETVSCTSGFVMTRHPMCQGLSNPNWLGCAVANWDALGHSCAYRSPKVLGRDRDQRYGAVV